MEPAHPTDTAEPDSATVDTTARIAAHIAARIAARAPGASLDRLLAHDVKGNELTSLLLHAYRSHAARRGFGTHKDALAKLPLTAPSAADGRLLHAFDAALFDAATFFDVVDLAPVAPLGLSAAAGVEQNHVLGALRLTEVVADPTTALALVAAQRRRAAPADVVRLCASHRVVRMQPLTDRSFTPHFRLAALVSAFRGDDELWHELELHIATWVAALHAARARGFAVGRIRVALSDRRLVCAFGARHGVDMMALAPGARVTASGSTEAALAAAGIAPPRDARMLRGTVPDSPLAARYDTLMETVRNIAPDVDACFDLGRLLGLSYYEDGPLLHIDLEHRGGWLSLGDGGVTGWVGALLSDQRERFLTTGVGSELLVKLFGPPR